MISHSEDIDYDKRQLNLMLSTIDLFQRKQITAAKFVSNLKSLLNVLRIKNDDFESKFLQNWGVCEVIHALALDAIERSLPSTDIQRQEENEKLFIEAAQNLKSLVESRILILSD